MINTSKMLAAAAATAIAFLPAAASAGGGNKGNIVAAAVQSKDHETLVAAVKAAGLVDTLASGGPFTVFAPTDAAFAGLVAWLNAAGLDPALACAKVLDRGEYGWVEFVAHRECDGPEAARRFYARLGAYLAVLHALEAIRREPVRQLLQTDLASFRAMAMAPGPEHDTRNRQMQAKRDAGVEALVDAEGDVVVELWEQEKAMFAYDAEDHAAEWWNDWGLLKERANDSVRVRYESVPVFQIQADVHANAQEVSAGGD